MSRRSAPLFLAALAIAAAPAAALRAQDTRRVVEPTIPPACTVLAARLSAVGDSTLAEADEARPDTRRIQDALDHCPSGRAVVLKPDGARAAFLAGPLHLRSGVTLVVDRGAVLFGSRNPRDYDASPGSCGVVSRKGHGCRALINGDRALHAGVMGDGTIDGRGWATMLGQDASWWALAERARNAKDSTQNCPRLLELTRSDDFTLYRITLRNAANFHVWYGRGDGFTAWGVTILTPEHARNTDGIDPASSRNVTIAHAVISTGDDNVAIKGGGSLGPTSNVTVAHSRFYEGHGMSIGSETDGGVRDVLVTDLAIDGADNGLRIKSNASRGGRVERVTYEDVCVRGSRNPVYMDTHYSASARTTGDRVPEFRDVVLRDVRVSGRGRVTLDGYDATRRLGITLDGVAFDAPDSIRVRAAHADVTLGPRGTNLPIAGEDVRVTGATGVSRAAASTKDCAGKFVPLPAAASAGTARATPDGLATRDARPASPRLSAIVDARHAGPDGALVDSVPTYRTLGAALAGLPANGAGRVVIFLRNGRYREKLTVDRPRVTLLGESRDGTVITYDAAAGTRTPFGGTFGTRGSFTLRVIAPDFRAENLTIENAFDYLGNAARPDGDSTRLRDAQAVALMTDHGSDRAAFVNVRIVGHQDTLFANAGRHYFYRCVVEGSVDFIFGAGQAVFDDCDVVSRDRGSKTNNGYVAAPSTRKSDPYGFLFVRSRLKKERPAMAPASVVLGRPWHPFGDPDVQPSAVFVECWMDDHVAPKGWDRMSMVDSTGGRTWWEPETARFFEYRSTGPGAAPSPRRRQLTDAQAREYTVEKVLRGWMPAR